MAATFVFVLFLSFLVGGLMLILVNGYMATEEQRARQESERRPAAVRTAEVVTAIPGVLPAPGIGRTPAMPLAFDDALLAQLEKHVRAEQAIVTQFVRYPSVDSLYRQEGQVLHVH